MEELRAPQPLAKQVLRQAREQERRLLAQRLLVGSEPGEGAEDAGGAAQVAPQRPHLSLQEHGQARWGQWLRVYYGVCSVVDYFLINNPEHSDRRESLDS